MRKESSLRPCALSHQSEVSARGRQFVTGSLLMRTAIVGVGFVWSTRASVVFISEIITPARKVLAVYPVFFFYTFLGWMVIIQ